MRHITVNVPVRTPAEFAVAYAYAFFCERDGRRDASPAALRLTLHAAAATLSADVPVRVQAEYRGGKAGHGAEIHVAWQASEDTGAYPSFRGTLKAVAGSEREAIINLAGFYSPPGGVAGAAFDAVVGGRIAYAAIDRLLGEIADGAARDYGARTAP
jgi:hypothetical protein